jgi:hypothetical protein
MAQKTYRNRELAVLRNMLARLTEKIERANSIQHSGGQVNAEDWSELYQLANESRAILKGGAL